METTGSTPTIAERPFMVWSAREKGGDLGEESLGSERLGHVARGPGAQRLLPRRTVAARGDEEDRERPQALLRPDELDDLEAADVPAC